MDFAKIESKTGTIPLFEKILLSTDGSITSLLELLLEEEIKITHIKKDEKIDLNQDKVRREVIIKASNDSLIHAVSVINTKNTPSQLLHPLAFDDTPIGKILSKNKPHKKKKEIMMLSSNAINNLILSPYYFYPSRKLSIKFVE